MPEHDLRNIGIGCALLLTLCGVIILVAYLWLFQPWLPFTEPEIQSILDRQFPNSGARVARFWEDYPNCRIVITYVNGGTRYVEVQRIDSHWKYIDDVGSESLWVDISCPRDLRH
jgi:hypothetical protein